MILYVISFLISLAALTAWFYFQDNTSLGSFFRRIFLVGVTTYLFSWIVAAGDWDVKIPALLRELIILGFIPLFLSLFRKKRWLYFFILVGVMILMRQYYFHALQNTFHSQVATEESDLRLTDQHPEPITLDSAGELILQVRDPARMPGLKKLSDQWGFSYEPAFQMADRDATDLDNCLIINLRGDAESRVGEVADQLRRSEDVIWVEENEVIYVQPMRGEPVRPSPDIAKKYGLNDPGLEQLWGFEAMKIAELYPLLKKATPRKKATIAILDTGVDARHEDLAANYQSLKSAYDTDKLGHGTHCAGIAAAVSNNAKGIASFSQTNTFIQITSVKVLSDNGFGTQKSIINGILEAADGGADVLSLSLGGLSNDSRQRAYKKAITYALNKGAVVVVAAGNANRNAKDFVPAGVEGVIAVSAVDTFLQKASFSNTVEDLEMGIAAPGVKIYSSIPADQYQTFNGTSMATPYVAGLIGIMKSLRPDLHSREIYEILRQTGMETGDTRLTGKLIYPAAAITVILENQ